MALEVTYAHQVESVIRALASAGKSLRLYPASSPIPGESVSAVVQALGQLFENGQPVVSLAVAREGFAVNGESVASNAMGVSEFVSELRSHGIAEIDLTPGCSVEEILGFLKTIARPAEEVRAQGGIAAAILAAGANNIRVTDVQLTVVEQIGPAPDEDFDEFLRNLAKDPEKLASWFAAASAGDPHAFEESLMELVRVVGPSGYGDMLSALSSAFMAQHPESKDALLGLAMEAGPTRDLTGSMFSLLSTGDIAGSVLGGSFGKNMLSLSTALTRLPLEEITAQVRADVQAMLPTSGHSSKEADFLNHMIEARELRTPEPSLVDVDPLYRQIQQSVALTEEAIAAARGAVISSESLLSEASVKTILTLLDQQRDFELYCSSIDSLAGMVPKLVEQRDLELAARVLSELSRRATLNIGPWPDLSGRLRDALAKAGGARTMSALMRALVQDPEAILHARSILQHAGDSASASLVSEAIALKAPGLEIAQRLLGRRLIDLLAQQAGQAQWFQIAPIASQLAQEADLRSTQALESLMTRKDEQSRREVASGVAAVDTPLATRLLTKALHDPSTEVVIATVRAMVQSRRPGSAALFATRLAEIDIDNADFAIGRELIAGLAKLPDRVADETLDKLAARKSLMKRGHFSEVQDLANQARAYRKQAGGAR